MDISVIKSNLVNDFNGIKIGSETAPKHLIEFINLRCPYCKKWFEKSEPVLNQAVSQGKIQRIIKLLDKDKPSLQRGNVMHEYISLSPDRALLQIRQAFETQESWQELELEDVAAYAEKTLHFTRQDTQTLQREIRNEAEQANIKFVPTLILGQHIFDESIDLSALNAYLAE